jgi:hypothetical protein
MDREQHAQAGGPRNEAKEMLLAMRDRIESLHMAVAGLSALREQDPLERAEPVLPALFNLHDAVFRHAIAIEAGEAAPTAFAFDLLRLVEGELEAIGIEVIRPVAGEEPDLAVMKPSNSIDAPWWRVPGQICRVEACGFVAAAGGRRRVLRKASVVVYRRRD